jgi:hypothetical protein
LEPAGEVGGVLASLVGGVEEGWDVAFPGDDEPAGDAFVKNLLSGGIKQARMNKSSE